MASGNVLSGGQVVVDYLDGREPAADFKDSRTGVWELPSLGTSSPAIGGRYQPD